MINNTIPLNDNLHINSQLCSDAIKDCYNKCYESRLNLSSGLGDKFEIVLTIYVIIILYMMFSHHIIKNQELNNKINDRIKLALIITSLYIISIIYIF